MKANSKIEKSDLVGGIQDFPIEVVEKMIEEQVKQDNLPDVEVFQENPSAGMDDGGFNWRTTEQGYDFWDEVIAEGNFDLFFMIYNKTTNTNVNKSEDEEGRNLNHGKIDEPAKYLEETQQKRNINKVVDNFRKEFCERCGSQRCSGQDDELEDCERFKNLIDNLEKTSVKNHKMGPKSKLPSKHYEEMQTKRDIDKFEYKVIELTPLYNIGASKDGVINWNVDLLNEWGNKGWEVCGVDGNKYLLKRKIY